MMSSSARLRAQTSRLTVDDSDSGNRVMSKERRKKKSRSPIAMSIRRAVLRFHMLPKNKQILLSAVITLCFGIGCTIAWNSLYVPHGGTIYGILSSTDSILSKTTTSTAKFEMNPRLIRLLWQDEDCRNATTSLEENVPPYGKRLLIAKYNPLPHLHDNNKLSDASTMDRLKCQRVADWQIDHRPTCNSVHEIASVWEEMNVPARGDEDRLIMNTKLVAGGAFRHVWMIREFDGTKRALKTLRVDGAKKKFDIRSLDRHRRDAMAMEQLSSSPLVVDVYGHCSNSAIFAFGEGGDLSSIFERTPDISKKELLGIAYNVSLSIAHAHHPDKHGRPTIAHTDIKPDQFLYQDGYYKLNDFNRARFLMWNQDENKQCGFKVGRNGGIWRSPEEYGYKLETEKVDVYSLGNVLYFLLTREYPWNDHDVKEVYEKVLNEKRPRMPEKIVKSKDPFHKYMIEAIQMCFVHDPIKRPSAKMVAEKLAAGLDEMGKN
jgi:hypothetical protein